MLPVLPMPAGVAELLEVAWPSVVALLPVSAPLPLPRTVSLSSNAALLRNSGAASSTTRYWFICVKIVEIWRWPNASYSVSSIVCTGTPSRLAFSRSIVSLSSLPLLARLLSTSESSGRLRNASVMRAAKAASSPEFTSDSAYWYSVAAMRVSSATSCTGFRYSATPGIPATAFCRRGSTTSSAPRSPRGFSTMLS